MSRESFDGIYSATGDALVWGTASIQGLRDIERAFRDEGYTHVADECRAALEAYDRAHAEIRQIDEHLWSIQDAVWGMTSWHSRDTDEQTARARMRANEDDLIARRSS